MANKKPSERYVTHKIGSSSDALRPIAEGDLIVVQDVSEETADDQVRVATQRDLIEDYMGYGTHQNLFDPTTGVGYVEAGKYINTSGGTSSSASYTASGYVPVTAGKTYYIKNVPNAAAVCYAFYNGSKVFVAGSYVTCAAVLAAGKKIVAPANSVYMRFSMYNSEATAQSVEEIPDGWDYPCLPYRGFKKGVLDTKLVISRDTMYEIGDGIYAKQTNNVLYYGARGKSTIDDTAAFTRALAGCDGTLYVPNGTYYITGIDILAAHPVSIIGESQDKTIIRSFGTTVLPLITIKKGVTGVSIQNLTMYSADVAMIHDEQPKQLLVKNVTFNTGLVGITISSTEGSAYKSDGTSILNCVFRNITGTAILIDASGSDYILISNNQFITCACAFRVPTGVVSQNHTFSNNVLTYCGNATYAAIDFESARLRLTGNTINHNNGSAVKIISSGANALGAHIITNNHIVQLDGSAGTMGLNLIGCSTSVIANNYIYGISGKPCLTYADGGVEAAKNSVIIGNVFIGDFTDSSTGDGNVIEHNIDL